MEGLLQKITDGYDDIFKYADPRVENFFMMSSPVPSFIICVAYFIFVIVSPKIMENRKPVEIRRLLVVYNIAMVCLSSFCFYEFLMAGWLTGYNFGCQPVDYSNSPKALRMVRVCWVFYISKFIELLDTIFFIMRKKFSQVTFLHVFHHGVMPISWWFGVKLVPGGFGTFHSLLNSFIHLVMYTYYALAALGPAFQKYLWWKRYMTTMQITQFISVMVHSSQLLFIECDYPIFFVYWIGFYALIFFIMFGNFYIHAYSKPANKSQQATNGSVKDSSKSKQN